MCCEWSQNLQYDPLFTKIYTQLNLQGVEDNEIYETSFFDVRIYYNATEKFTSRAGNVFKKLKHGSIVTGYRNIH